VTPEESERLALASTEGKIQLALRNPMDTATLATPGVKPGILLGMSQPRSLVVRKPLAPGQPAPPPPPPPSVEVIKGDKRSQVVVG
jgi:pilus assembly protein CpaB